MGGIVTVRLGTGKLDAAVLFADTPRQEERMDGPQEAPTDGFFAIEQGGGESDFACGHKASTLYTIMAYGTELTPKPEFLEKRERCGACEAERLKALATRCIACRRVILPGDQVATYVQGIGCMRRDCSGYMGAGALSGHWTGTGVRSLDYGKIGY
jgi:hypothetical protein